MITRLLRTPATWAVAAVLAAGAAFGLYWFQPWRLVTDTEVRESLSAVGTTTPAPSDGQPATPAPSDGQPATPTPSGAGTVGGSPSAAPAGPVLVRQGSFVTHEHATSGRARIVRLPDGAYRLELVGLDTSDGPDLRVWLTDQPVRSGTAGWRVFDDGRWVELGRLKGNRGDQSYRIPPDVDLTGLTSVSVWCKRFSVSFGAAPLDAVG